MANSISNQFIITALQDGSVVQGSLRINGSLSQNYNPSTQKTVPDWKADASTRPSIYPVLRKGATYLSSSQLTTQKWLYNGVEIQFGEDGKSTNFKDTAGSALFKVSTTSVTLGGTAYNLPLLTVISNLASALNVDLDTIGFEGSVEIMGKQVDFSAAVDVKIAQMTAQGYLGVLSPESAIITAKGQSVAITAKLYTEDGTAPSTWYTRWFNAGTGEEYTGSKGQKSITINEADVTDNVIIRCDFYTDANYTNRVTTAFASIDDTQDPEYFYVSFNGSNSDFSGQLNPGESVEVTVWVATMEDRTAIDTRYTNFSVKFYDGNQTEITNGAPTMTSSANKGKVTITYDFVASHGYKVGGFVTAS